MKEGLIKMNSETGYSSKRTLRALENKLINPATKSKAEVWYPKAIQILEQTKGMVNFIDEIKTELIKEAGLERINTQSKNGDDNKIVYALFIKKGKGTVLQDSLEKYLAAILKVDFLLKKEFEGNIILTSEAFEKNKRSTNLANHYFKDITANEALLLLSQFQNNAKIAENQLIGFCNAQVSDSGLKFITLNPIVTISTQNTGPGKEIELLASIGRFDTESQPAYNINGKTVKYGDDGIVHYKLKAPAIAGNYSIPVTIKYIDLNGVNQTTSFHMKYTVTVCDKE